MITIVSGLPRSGTSVMMQMLVAGGLPALTDGERRADEDNPRGYFEFEPVKQTKRDPSWLERAEGRVVKMVSLLLFDLPGDRQYRIVLTQRDIGEVLASQAVMLRNLGRPPGPPDEEMRRIYEAHLRRLDGWLAERPQLPVLRVDYREVVRAPRETALRLAGFLGAGLDLERMAASVDRRLYRNRAD